MKTTLITLLAGISLLSAVGPSQSQAAGGREDGVTASPKHRQFLDEQKPAALVSTPKVMACAKCRDSVVTRTDWTARGATKPTLTVPKHLCDGCDTKMTTIGQGKAAKSVVSHSCDAGGSAGRDCCKAGS